MEIIVVICTVGDRAGWDDRAGCPEMPAEEE
jgi:hypothetical protein